MKKNVIVTSQWEYGCVETPGKVNMETGEISDVKHDPGVNDFGFLIQEYVEFDNGQTIEEHDICMVCHSYLLDEQGNCRDKECEGNKNS